MIQLNGVTKIYGKGEGEVVALTNVTLTIPTGKFVSIVGQSGSGKSTLMNIIGALDRVTSGQVFSESKELTKMKDNDLAEYRNKNIGYIFQSFYLEPTFTVLENVAMPLTIAGMPKKQREEQARAAIAKLGLTEKTNKKASELSGGQKQRVSIARALVHNPEVILADEPTGNLDSKNGREVIRLLQGICDEGKTVILVTHNLSDAKKTDMMVEIKDGEIRKITENTPEQKAEALREYDEYDQKGDIKDEIVRKGNDDKKLPSESEISKLATNSPQNTLTDAHEGMNGSFVAGVNNEVAFKNSLDNAFPTAIDNFLGNIKTTAELESSIKEDFVTPDAAITKDAKTIKKPATKKAATVKVENGEVSQSAVMATKTATTPKATSAKTAPKAGSAIKTKASAQTATTPKATSAKTATKSGSTIKTKASAQTATTPKATSAKTATKAGSAIKTKAASQEVEGGKK